MQNELNKEVQKNNQVVENNKETTQVSTETNADTASDTVVVTDENSANTTVNLAELPAESTNTAPVVTVDTSTAGNAGAAFTVFNIENIRDAVEIQNDLTVETQVSIDNNIVAAQESAPADFARGNTFLDNNETVDAPVVNQPVTEPTAPVVDTEAANRAAAEQATRDIEARIARDLADREAAQRFANAEADRLAGERELAAKAAAEEAARIAAERAAAEEAARIAAERAAAEEAARIAAERAAAEEAARIAAERAAAEEAARIAAEEEAARILNQLDNRWVGTDADDTLNDPNGVFSAHAGNGNDSITINFAREWDNDANAGNGARSDGRISGGYGDDEISITMNNSKFFINMRSDEIKADDKLDGQDIVRLLGIYGNSVVNLGGNDDQFFGGNGNDSVSGGNGADRLVGGAGNDGLNGGDGDDIIQGGLGNDSLTGGDDHDRFVWAKEDLSATSIDTVTDFNAKEDSLDFSDMLQGLSDAEIEELVRVVEIKAMRGTDNGTTFQVQMHDKVTDLDSKTDWTTVANFSRLSSENGAGILKNIIANSHE